MKLQLALFGSLFVSSYAGKHWNDWDVSGQADRDLADRCLFFIKYETGTSAFETSPGTGNTNGNCNTAYTGTSLDGDDVATVAIPSGSSNTEEFTVTLNKFGCEFTGEVRHKAANTWCNLGHHFWSAKQQRQGARNLQRSDANRVQLQQRRWIGRSSHQDVE